MFKKHKEVVTGVFNVIDQNMKIFRGFNHRPYFRRFSKNPLDFREKKPEVVK